MPVSPGVWLVCQVPLVMFLMTHAYFLFYHTLSSLVLRRVEAHLSHASLLTRKVARCLVVFLLAYATAFMETLTIAHVSEGGAGVWWLSKIADAGTAMWVAAVQLLALSAVRGCLSCCCVCMVAS